MSFHPASLWIQKNNPERGRFSPVTNPAPDSGAYHADERSISCSELNRWGETRILPSRMLTTTFSFRNLL
jgi:hypothetical protein